MRRLKKYFISTLIIVTLIIFNISNVNARQFRYRLTITDLPTSNCISRPIDDLNCAMETICISVDSTSVPQTGILDFENIPDAINWDYKGPIGELVSDGGPLNCALIMSGNIESGTDSESLTNQGYQRVLQRRFDDIMNTSINTTIDYELQPIVSIIEADNPTLITQSIYCADESLTLNATPGFSSYSWYYTTNLINPGPNDWVFITGSATPRVSITSNSLANIILNPVDLTARINHNSPFIGNDIVIGVAAGSRGTCPECIPSNMINNNLTPPLRFEPPTPEIITDNMSSNKPIGIAPVCPGGQGSIQFTHSPETVTNTNFIYTITQLQASDNCIPPRLRDDCANGTSTDPRCNNMPITLRDIRSDLGLSISNSALSDFDDDNQNFCELFIGNFTYDIPGISETERTIIIDENGIFGGGSTTTETLTSTGNNTTSLSLFPGIYQIEIESSNENISCFQKFFLEIPEITETLSASVLSPVNDLSPPTCVGASDGSAVINVSSFRIPFIAKVGTTPAREIQYSVDGGNETSVSLDSGNFKIDNLRTGEHTIVIRDGCTADGNEVSFNFMIPSSSTTLTLVPSGLVPANCTTAESGDGEVTITATDIPGISYMNFTLTDGSSNLTPSRDNGRIVTFNNLRSDINYTANVTPSLECTVNNGSPIMVGGPSNMNTITMTAFPPTCSNVAVGSLQLSNISRSGGASARGDINFHYVINRSDGTEFDDGDIMSGGITTIGNIDVANGYELILTDNCRSNARIPTSIGNGEFNISRPPLALDLEEKNTTIDVPLSCFDDETPLTVTWNQGTDDYNSGPFSILISKTGMDDITPDDVPDGTLTFTSGDLPVDNVNAYTITVTDACSISNSRSFNIRSVADTIISATVRKVPKVNTFNLSCPQANDGVVTIDIEGGNPYNRVGKNYNVVITGPGAPPTYENISGESDDFFTFARLREDVSYVINVTDASGCLKPFPVTPLTAPPSLSLRAINDTDFTNISPAPNTVTPSAGERFLTCNGNRSNFTANVSGAIAPYTITLTSSVLPAPMVRMITTQGGGSTTFPSLGPGTYMVSVTSGVAACNTAAPTQQFILTEPTPLTVAGQVNPYTPSTFGIRCNGERNGRIQITPGGGLPPYQYTLYGKSTTNPVASTNPSTPGSDTTITITSGSTNPLVRVFNNLPSSDGLGEINYSWEITDGLGCPVPRTGSIILTEPDPVTIAYEIESRTTSNFEIPCKGDEATVIFTLSGGYTEGTYSINVPGHTVDELGSVNGEFIYSLPAGSYLITGNDQLSCNAVNSFTLNIREPDTNVSVDSYSATPPVCIGGDDGLITITATGGTPNPDANNAYSFMIRRVGSGQLFSDEKFGTTVTYERPANDLVSQDYEIMIQDNNYVTGANSCSFIQPITVPSNPNPLTIIQDSILSPSCYGGDDGFIEVSVSNATLAPGNKLTYFIEESTSGLITSFDTASTSFRFEGLQGFNFVGAYNVWVRDDNNCAEFFRQRIDNIRLVDEELITINLVESIRPTCFSNGDGSLIVNIDGGVPPYRISLDSATFIEVLDDMEPITHTFTNLLEGQYEVFVIDSNYERGLLSDQNNVCIISEPFDVLTGRVFEIVEADTTNVSCFQGNDGAISVELDIANRNPGESINEDNLNLNWYKNIPFTSVIGSLNELEDLSTGNYFLNITYSLDTAVCDTLYSFPIIQPDTALFIGTITEVPTTCGNENNGIARFSIGGGYPSEPVFYSVDEEEWKQLPESLRPDRGIITELSVGEHNLRIGQSRISGNEFRCIATQDFSIREGTFEISSEVTAPIICSGDFAEITIRSNELLALEYAQVNGTFTSNPVFRLSAGTYEFVARRQGQIECLSDTISVTLSDPDQITFDRFETENADCDQQNGSVSVINLRGGTGNLTLQWMDLLGNSVNPDSLFPAEYQLAVSDSIGCEILLGSFGIGNNPTVSLSSMETRPADCSTANGVSTLTITNGQSPFDINGISFDESIIQITNLLEGDSIFSITDSRGCSDQITITTTSQNLLSVSASITNTTCNESNGVIRVNIMEGLAPFTYVWQGFSTTADSLHNLPPGNYQVTITDANGCERILNESVQPTDGVNGVDFTTTQSFCDLPNGQINIDSVRGDFPPFLITLNTPNGDSTIGQINRNESIIIDELPASTYGLSITDNNNCLFPIAGISITDDISRLFTVSVAISDSSACNLSTGQLVATTNGGLPPFTYEWINESDEVIGENSNLLTDIAAGMYSVEVTDANGCKGIGLGNMVDRNNPILQVLARTTSPFGAANGTVTLNAFNGSGLPYTFSITGNETNDSNETGLFENLAPGSYTAMVTDRLGCESLPVNFQIEGTEQLSINLINTSAATCGEADNGSARVNASGGIAPYTFVWNAEEHPEIRTDLFPGDYSVRVTDAIGSIDSVAFTINQLPEITAESFVTDASCEGTCDGQIRLLVSGGSEIFNISWNTGQTGASLSELCPGTYFYTITDQSSETCILTDSVVVGQFPSISITLDETISPTCNQGTDGRININISGGSNDYLYQWSNGTDRQDLTNVTAGTYDLIVTDLLLGCMVDTSFTVLPTPAITLANSDITQPSCAGGSDGRITIALDHANTPLIRWDHGDFGFSTNGLSAGTYPFTVSDRNGCTLRDSVTIIDREQLIVESTSTDASCFNFCDGSISLEIVGGTAPYFLQWNTGARTTTIGNLCAGEYTYTVTDFFNCQVIGNVIIGEPDPIIVSDFSITNTSCFGDANGSISIEVTGGNGEYTYSWSNGATTNNISELSAGTYEVMISDSNGCIGTHSFRVTQPTRLLTENDETKDPSCPGESDGMIIVNAIGGTSPYTYSWSDNLSINEHIRNDLTEGNYSVTITDANNCTITRDYTLSDPAGLQIARFSIIDPVCFNDANGSISIEVLGGLEPYTYNWSNGESTVNIGQLPEGIYSVDISDANGCTISESFELINPEELFITGISDMVTLCEGGSFFLEPDTDWATYFWESSNGETATTKGIEVSEEGEYTLTVSDENGCTASFFSVVEVSENALEADFLRISESFAFEPIVFVDISVPIPNETEWILPDDPDIVINRNEEGILEVVFTRTGEFTIGMRARSFNCESEAFKTISITESSGRSQDQSTENTLRDQININAFPNPAKGRINITVALDDESPAEVMLLSNLNRKMLRHQKLEGSKDYLVRWDVPELTAGIYLIYVVQNDKITTERIIIK